MSFDTLTAGACEKQLGHGLDDDSAIAARGFDVECGDLDANRERSEFARLRAKPAGTEKRERDAYAILLSAFTSYRKHYPNIAEKECGGGVGCSSEMDLEEAHVNYEFLIAAEGFRGAALPSFSAQDALQADADLNAVYLQELAKNPPKCPAPGSDNYDETCVSRDDLRATQRAWIRYRDAFLSYGAIRWPQVPRDSWFTYLEREKTKDQW